MQCTKERKDDLFLLATYDKDRPLTTNLTGDATIIQRELKMLTPVHRNDHGSAIQNVLCYLATYRLSRGFDRLGEVIPSLIST